jgi:hypothetical protein
MPEIALRPPSRIFPRQDCDSALHPDDVIVALLICKAQLKRTGQ